MLKKIMVAISVLFVGSVGLVTALPPQVAYGAQCAADVDANFLSFPTWYRGLCKDGSSDINLDGEKIPDIIFKIALNIIDIALRAVGIMAVGFVIYGGFRYIISRGSPEEMKKALDIILKAVIGMVIAIIAATIVTFISYRLGG